MDGLKARLSFDAVAYDYDDEYLTIDTDTHIININNLSRLFGVQYDGNSKLIKFRISNKLSDIQKMQDSIVYINWIDSKGVKGQSIAIDKTISNDICEFAWKVPFDALKNSRVLHFAMSAVITENSSSVINQKWSTQIASVIIPDGIYIKSYTPSSEEEDRIAQIYNELSRMINKQNDVLKADIDVERKRIDVLNDGGLIIKDELIENNIKTWLDEHPEATTTVQDGSIGYEKFNESFKNQIISVISEKTGDITDLINKTLKSNMHLRIYNSNIELAKGLSFKNIENVTLEFINSKIIFKYDHDNRETDQTAILMEDCKNVLIKGLEITTDFSEENDETLDLSPLVGDKIYAINFTRVENGMISNCIVSQFTDGLSINYSKNIYSFRNTLFNIGEEPAAFRNSSRCKMTDCEAFWHCGDGTLIKHHDTYELSGFIFADNYFHDGKVYEADNGRLICGGGFTSNVETLKTIKRDPEYIIVKNNVFIDTEYGALFAGGSHIIVDGNLVRSKMTSDGKYYTYAAMGLDYSAYNLPRVQKYSDIKFINNTIENGSRGIYISIHSDQNVTITHEDILISGNIVKNCINEALETHNSLVIGNVFENVNIINLYDSTFCGNKFVGTLTPTNQWVRLRANDSDVICNRITMNDLVLDIQNKKAVSVAYNVIEALKTINIERTDGYVYITKNTVFTEPTYNFINNCEEYVIVDGEPYKKNMISSDYFSYVKKNGIVELDFISTKTPNLTTNLLKLGTLPEGYRPFTISRHIIYTNPSSGGVGKFIRIEINQGGEVFAIANENISGAPLRGCLTFLASSQ